MHGEALLQDLAIIMIVAGLVTVVFHRLRQPVVLGYILAGLIVGPHTPPFQFLKNEHQTIESLAEIGVVFLMFSLGLHFSLRKLARVGATAVIAATLEIVLMVLVGYLIGRMFHWSKMDSLFLGAILSISSTTIIVKALTDLGRLKEKFSELIFGILIVEDILAIAMIALLSSIAMTGSFAVADVAKTLLTLSVFLAVVLTVGLLTVPPLLRYVARFRSNEMLLIATLGLCFGVSLIAVKLGYSVALGAFLIGAIMAEAREAGKIETLIESVRDMFSAVFFVAVGMLIDPKLMVQYWVPIVVITAVVVVGKVLACTAGTFLAGHGPRTSLRVGMGLAQIGEFSFIIAQLGLTLNVTSKFLYPIAVTVSAITTLLTPYLIRASDPMVNALERSGRSGLLSYLEGYGQWLGRLSDGKRGDRQIRRLLRKWAFQVALNIALLSGLFIVAAWLGGYAEDYFTGAPRWTGGPKALVWLAAMLAALPLLVATFRKLRAAAMVIAEASIPRSAGGAQTAALRAVVGNTILIAVSTGVVLWVLLLSSTVLPPWPVLIALAVVIALVGVVSWGSLVRVYAQAQIALRATLTTDHPPHVAPAPATDTETLPSMLKDALLETIPLPSESAAAGKLIRELQLRTRTGASIVGIERNGVSLINPGADDELLPGDRVLLLGTGPQLAAARTALG
ncbi:MAG: monovalent cation:H+ antiporter-2, family [Humisphaera sp.]|nr:monovalent cation:H+ antiporter-2, family [Humisphaera sp.]